MAENPRSRNKQEFQALLGFRDFAAYAIETCLSEKPLYPPTWEHYSNPVEISIHQKADKETYLRLRLHMNPEHHRTQLNAMASRVGKLPADMPFTVIIDSKDMRCTAEDCAKGLLYLYEKIMNHPEHREENVIKSGSLEDMESALDSRTKKPKDGETDEDSDSSEEDQEHENDNKREKKKFHQGQSRQGR